MAARHSTVESAESDPCRRARWQVLLGGIAWMILTLAGCGADPMAPDPKASSGGSAKVGFDSPQAVFDAEVQSQIDKDWGAHYDTYSPESQDVLIGNVALGAVMTAARGGKAEEVKAVFQNHGIDESMMPRQPSMADMADFQSMLKEMEKTQTELAATIKDKRAFYMEMASLLGGAEPQTGEGGPPATELSDVEVTGDTAVGNREIDLNGTAIQAPIRFVRIDGSWYMCQPTPEEARELGRRMGEQMGRELAEKMKLDAAK